MRELYNTFVSRAFLKSVWALDYQAFKGSDEEAGLHERLKAWAKRKDLKETSAEAAFLDTFFKQLWGYSHSGHEGDGPEYTLHPRFPVKGAGAKGGTGEADLAIGWFERDGVPDTPQILCEFKDIRSSLDAPQKRRKGNTRSPVKQCLDYLSAARREMIGNEAVLPTWGIVTDMNEFRLYWYDRAPQQSLRFVIQPTDLLQGRGLLGESEEARFDRFLFWRVFHRETLLTTGGKSLLAQLIARQWIKERELENTFYAEYRAYREKLYEALLSSNPNFPGTRGRLVRLAQKILDRCIFIFFCEDMGRALGFPPQLLRDFLIDESRDRYFDPRGTTIWQRLLTLFRAMNEGTAFGPHQRLNQFNGGLFAPDPELEGLSVPNAIFCQQMQGENEASLYTYKETLLYLSASYNYASGWAEGLTRAPVEPVIDEANAVKQDPENSLGLYTLGRIFEQSITELEILEAEADERPSLNKVNKRKRDGVYYTPEWVVERIVKETLGARLDELKQECGWPETDDKLPDEAAIDAYRERLISIKVLDPACGSGAFLITCLRFLLDEWHALQALRKQVTGDYKARDEDQLVADILRGNIYGVDINPASVEITCLALWLHTARSDKPLSHLDHTIQDGNSLVDDRFFRGVTLDLYSDDELERVNVFNWDEQFPEVMNEGGFDVVVGNPPYVKLQNFRKVHEDVAEFLRDGRPGYRPFVSTQTGNFDIFLPFIEGGIKLLNDKGRLGFIAPSLWTMNDYGRGLRDWLSSRRYLDKWIDFGSFQVFDEATTYTALQFYARTPRESVKIARAPDGLIPENPWTAPDCALTYDRVSFGDRWLLLTGTERDLIDKLQRQCRQLSDEGVSRNIFVGIQTSADAIYHLKKIGPGKFLHRVRGRNASHSQEVELEDEVMKPLVSGAGTRRYVERDIDTYLLFPYELSENGAELISSERFKRQYPKAWDYLCSHENELRGRENGKMDDDERWWAYVYPKNLARQHFPKLLIPRLVSDLFCVVDKFGEIYLDNVDVGGVRAAENQTPFFLAGIINSPVCNFVFKRISKPFRGDYRSANKQFISPLPIPPASEAQQEQVAELAKELQRLHTERHRTIEQLEKRLSVAGSRTRPETFLFPDLLSARKRIGSAPRNLNEAEQLEWAKRDYEQDLAGRIEEIGSRLHETASLDAQFEKGELRFLIDGVPVLDRIFLSDEEGVFILAQWKVLASTFSITPRTDGKKLCNALRKLADTDNQTVRQQIISLEVRLSEVETEIERREGEMNQLVYELYGLTEDEIRLVEVG